MSAPHWGWQVNKVWAVKMLAMSHNLCISVFGKGLETENRNPCCRCCTFWHTTVVTESAVLILKTHFVRLETHTLFVYSLSWNLIDIYCKCERLNKCQNQQKKYLRKLFEWLLLLFCYFPIVFSGDRMLPTILNFHRNRITVSRAFAHRSIQPSNFH